MKSPTRRAGFAAALLFVVVLIVWGPGQIYSGNAAEFRSGFRAVFEYLLLIGTSLFLLLVGPLAWFEGRLLVRYVGGLAVASLFVVVTSGVLNPDYGQFNGQPIDFSSKYWLAPIEIAVFAVLFFLVRRGLRRSPEGLASILLLFAIGMGAQPIARAILAANTSLSAKVNHFAFSPQKNVLVVLLDGFQSDVFAEIVSEHPKIKSALTGFTYFPDTAGVGATTYLSLPSIHSGEEYKAGEPIRTYFKKSISDQSFLSKLASSGYKVTLVNPLQKICPKGAGCVDGADIVHAGGARNLTVDTALQLIDLSIFRAAPSFLAMAAYNNGQYIVRRYFIDRALTNHVPVAKRTMEVFADELDATAKKPSAYFLHMMIPHPPVELNSACKFVAETLPFTRENYKAQALCGLRAFMEIINSLKKSDVYNATTIALIADHGIGFPSARVTKEEAAKQSNPYWPGLVGLANPTFVIKPAGAIGEFKVSENLVDLPELGATICNLTGDCTAPGSPAFVGNGDKSRIFNYYEWKTEYWEADTMPIFPQTITGVLWSAGAWNMTEATQ